MCGFAGYVGIESPGVLPQMLARVAHRGPDGCGFWRDPTRQVHFAHARLAILDRAGGRQPMCSAGDEVVVIFNGELYNASELRAELTALGHRFESAYSDTEVLLHGYREWQEAVTERLNGMWSFVIHDGARGRLFASRDRFGEKPLYYALIGDTLLFGSELGALRAHPVCPTALAPLALQKYFAHGFVPAPLTVLEQVRKLQAGHAFTFDLATRTLSVWRYWEYLLEPEPSWDHRSEEDLADELLVLLRQAVRRRLAADVKLGVFLSGGIDSSAVAALTAAELGVDSVETFTIGFEEDSFDEAEQARVVARHLGLANHSQSVCALEAQRIFRQLQGRLDEPLADPSLVPTYALAELGRRHVGVALGGDGGDELFAGYDTFRALRYAAAYAKWVPRVVHPAIVQLCSHLPVGHNNLSLDFKLRRFLRGAKLRPAHWHSTWLAPSDEEQLAVVFGTRIDPEEIFSEAVAAWESAPGGSVVDRSLQFYTRVYLPDNILTKTDRASMLHGLELRSPFLDRDLADFARRLPARFKLRGNCTKYLLKRALRNVLPAEIISRRKKGFGLPIGGWIKSGRFRLDGGWLPAGLRGAPFVAAQQEHIRGRRDHRQLLWCAAMLSAWQEGLSA